jgi:hypothetical protein
MTIPDRAGGRIVTTRTTLACLLAALPILAAATPPAADSGIPWVGEVVFASPAEASVLMRPDAAGAPLTDARLAGGGAVDATVAVRLVDEDYLPVAYFPREDVWLQFAIDPGTADGCVNYGIQTPGGPFLPDHATDLDGWTEWSQPLWGGGWSGGPATVFLNGSPAMDPEQLVHPPVPLRVNGPDLDGDLVVDLTDVVLFTQDLHGSYRYRSDYDWNGVVNIVDIVHFTQAIGCACE